MEQVGNGKVIGLEPTISIMVLNVSGLKTPVKTQKWPDWIKYQDPTTHCPKETHFKYEDAYQGKVKTQKNKYHANANHYQLNKWKLLC